MLHCGLSIPNCYWSENVFRPPIEAKEERELSEAVRALEGHYSFAFQGRDGAVTLVRDRLGTHKLFFAIHRTGTVKASNYLVDLVREGVPFEAIYSVPAGHWVVIKPEARNLTKQCYFPVRVQTALCSSPGRVARNIRDRLEACFGRLAAEFGERRVFVCLSGGLDSGLIAAMARKYFGNVTAYTYGYSEEGWDESEDVVYARQLAEFLRMPLRFVPATPRDIDEALGPALCYGQDWRDFNVHCAVVNEILARAMREDIDRAVDGAPSLVLTGDLMNELLADYSPVSYRGKEYYSLPRMSADSLRAVLLQGLDAGDREIGIFHHHGLQVVQPYMMVLDQYLSLPGSLIVAPDSKQRLVRRIAGDLLPAFLFHRVKTRAQCGNAREPIGILPLLIDSGRDSNWMKTAFSKLFLIREVRFLNRFIRAGLYRFATEFPGNACTENGYFNG